MTQPHYSIDASMMMLTTALLLFVGSHLLLSHTLRAPLVRVVGNGGFAGVYSLVAFATFGWALFEWRRAPVYMLWIAPDWAWWIAAVAMLIGSILFVGSMTAPNPALMGAGRMAGGAAPRGVQRITRHPMMWAFALWASVHGTLSGDVRTVLLCVAVGLLALLGAWLQDGKKRGQLGSAWAAHEDATSFVPFGKQLQGRLAWWTIYPGVTALLGGSVLYSVLTWAHPALMGAPQLGFWRLFG